jgi:predicted GIY-YIG superfamily endonuclease
MNYNYKETKGRKKMVNYSNSIIYKLCCNNTDITDIYIGSTTNFSRRKCQHKSKCNTSNFTVYQFIRANGGWSAWDMVQIEQYEAQDKRNLHARERHWIEQLKPGLNQRIPTRTVLEWREEHKDQKKKYDKQYREQNKDRIAAREKIEVECECGAVVGKMNILRHRRTKQHKFYEQIYNLIYI